MDRDSVRDSWPDIVQFKEAILVCHGGIAIAGSRALQNYSGAWNGVVVRIGYSCSDTAGPLLWDRDLLCKRWGRLHRDQDCLREYPARNSHPVSHALSLVNKFSHNTTSEFTVADAGKQAARARGLRFLGLAHRAAAERAPHRAEVHPLLGLFQVAAVTAVEQIAFAHGLVVLRLPF